MYQGLLGTASAVMDQYRASGLAASLCTIQAPPTDSNSTPIIDAQGTLSGTYSNVPGLVNLPCQDAPESEGDVSAAEFKNPQQTASAERRHVLLDRYYPQLSPATNWGEIGWIAIIDGVTYDIRGADCDSQRTQSRLKLTRETV